MLHLVGFTEDIARFYPGAEIIALQFATPAYGKLVSYLSETFSRPEPSVAASSRKGLYPYSRHFIRQNGNSPYGILATPGSPPP